MAGRRTDGDRTRERVLEAAIPLFAAHGFAGTSVRMVAGAAGVNVATLAYHFDDKDGLYRAVVQRLHQDLSEAFPSLPQGSDPSTLLRSVIAGAWAFSLAHREHNRLLLRHVLDSGALPEVVVESWSEPLISRAVAVIAMFRPEWPAWRARLLVSSVQHLLVRWSVEDPDQLHALLGRPDDVDAAVVAFTEDLVRGQLGLR